MFLIYQFIEEYVSNGPAWLGLFFALSASMLTMTFYYKVHDIAILYKDLCTPEKPIIEEEEIVRSHNVLQKSNTVSN